MMQIDLHWNSIRILKLAVLINSLRGDRDISIWWRWRELLTRQIRKQLKYPWSQTTDAINTHIQGDCLLKINVKTPTETDIKENTASANFWVFQKIVTRISISTSHNYFIISPLDKVFNDILLLCDFSTLGFCLLAITLFQEITFRTGTCRSTAKRFTSLSFIVKEVSYKVRFTQNLYFSLIVLQIYTYKDQRIWSHTKMPLEKSIITNFYITLSSWMQREMAYKQMHLLTNVYLRLVQDWSAIDLVYE